MELKLKRYSEKPILTPKPYNLWENRYVFNPAVIYDGNLFHMLYRAQGFDMVSRIGYAVSIDGVNFNRFEEPVFFPTEVYEASGVEDPRITKIDDKYYMVYTAYSPYGIRVAMASTTDFIKWEKHGIILPDIENKDAALFPEKINGKYVLLHRIPPDIWLAFSEDLIHWNNFVKIASPRKDMWDNLKIGAGGPPIKTKYGWLLLYHGVEKTDTNRPIYRLGFMVLDKDDPTKVIKRSIQPILEPELHWEISGGVPYVVFSDAIVEYEDRFLVYYGGADNYIGLAYIEKDKVYEWMRE